jgi:translation initiation factor 3 subunit F
MKHLSLGVKGYMSRNLTVGGRIVMNKYEPVNLELYAYEAEKIGIDALINGHPDSKQLDAPASLLSDFDNLEVAMEKLLDMLDTVGNYVNKVVEGKTTGDVLIGRAIGSALASVPHMDSESFDKLFNENLQDLLMIVYLTNLTRTQLALADKMNTLLE